ncbi:MAG: LPS export ABC transporter periplasmic protein LptC [Chlorobi bacterium]|nr:LPS export ABC transporter periplasmic protein LptC [Chlorobiota bacterium]
MSSTDVMVGVVKCMRSSWLALFLLVVLCACDEELQPQRDLLPYDLLPSNTLYGTEIIFLDSIQTKALVRAGKVQWYPSQQLTLLDSGVYVEFFTRTGERAARLWCDSAKVENATNDMWAYGRVHVVSDSTLAQLQTRSLRWDSARRRLATNDYVRIERPGEIVEGGYGFESDENLRHYTIFRVTGSIVP